jgi:peptidoglycan/xylan/chitin deacetylase (PgdA/CDA1 family)
MTAALSALVLKRPADPHNAFTVDLEEWFHVCGVEPLAFERWATLPSRVEPTTRWLLDALDRANVCATFFIVGWIAERFPRLVETVRDAGHEIGSHSHSHRRVYELDGEAFRRDLQASVKALKAAGIADVSLFRAPEWSVDDGRIARFSAVSPPAADRGGADCRGTTARRRPVRTGDAPRLGLGIAHELAAPGTPCD